MSRTVGPSSDAGNVGGLLVLCHHLIDFGVRVLVFRPFLRLEGGVSSRRLIWMKERMNGDEGKLMD
jgi:hypothetical protein